MNNQHIDLVRCLIACQVALLEHAAEKVTEHVAKKALIARLQEALRLAKKLEE